MKDVMLAQVRFLFFQGTPKVRPEQRRLFFCYVLIVTWLVGMGRYWDDPDANILQHLGMGSVGYLFVMSGILWCAIRPLAQEPLPIIKVFLFVGLTSLPALLYAIPVELFMPVDTAAAVNYIFLAVVATWRVALLFFFCKRAVGLSVWGTMTAAILPLCCIMIVLASFSLEHVVFNIMSGVRVMEDYPRTTPGLIASSITDAAGWSVSTIKGLSILAYILFPIFLISWGVMAFKQINRPLQTHDLTDKIDDA